MNSYYVSVDLDNRRLYVERERSGFYLCGGLTDGRFPTYANRKEFAKYRIPYSGGLVDIPAGKLDFTFCPGIATAQESTYNQPVTFNDGLAESGYMSWYGAHVTHPRPEQRPSGKCRDASDPARQYADPFQRHNL